MKNRIWLVLGLIFVASNLALAQTAKKTITNEDLEKFRQQRVKAEAEYRNKYKELGMPSPEELEQQQKENRRVNEDLLRKSAIERQQNLGYWGMRTNDLRNQIINVEAQMRYLNAQISTLPAQNSIFATPHQVYSVGVIQYGNYGNRGNQYRPPNPANNVQTVINASSANPNPFYSTPLNNNGIKLVIGQPNYPRQRGYRRSNYGGGYAIGYPGHNSAQRDELVARLQYLGQVRAGLWAQWNNLADEARRAGVKID